MFWYRFYSYDFALVAKRLVVVCNAWFVPVFVYVVLVGLFSGF